MTEVLSSPRKRGSSIFTERSRRQFNQALFIVPFRGILNSDETAARAPVRDAACAACDNADTLGLHRAPAEGSAVAWVFVYMFAKETFRTMIRVAVARYTNAALFADEVLNFSDETHMITKQREIRAAK